MSKKIKVQKLRIIFKKTRKNMSKSHKKKKNKLHIEKLRKQRKESNRRKVAWNKGKHYSEESRKKVNYLGYEIFSR